jgi:outer membrane protein assembly factor BamB
MHTTSRFLALLFLTIAARAENWAQWRGPAFNGTSPEKNLPAAIAEKNIKWQTPLPGFSGATPAIWGGTIFATSPDENKDLLLFCLDRKDGKVRWKKTVATGGDITKGRGNMASPSPITDGKAVYALFGTGDFAAYDFQGNQLWARNLGTDYGKLSINWIYGSSPLLYGGKLYVIVLQRSPAPEDYPGLAGHGGERESFLLAVDPATGKTLWKHLRPSTATLESMETYATPVPFQAGGKTQILIAGGDCLTAHDAETGAEVWRGYGINRDNGGFKRLVATPVTDGKIALVCGPKQELAIAFRTDMSGDITASGIAWTFDEKQTPDVCTPIYSDGRFYLLNGDKQILTCLGAKNGAKIWQGSLGHRETVRSSPTLADGKIYTLSEKGTLVICDASPSAFKVLSTYQFPNAEPTRSTVAVSDGQLFVRTATALYCVGK